MVELHLHPASGNLTILRGQCVEPFLDVLQFGNGGHVNGRLCAKIEALAGKPICCLPCPTTDWVYPESFETWYRISESFSAVGLVICIFLLLSWACLPVEKTRRHYLSICLVIGVVMEALAFVIPLGIKPNQCFDEITPNDMYTSLTCAFSGAFIVGGGLVVTVWIFVRALSMHLQICWDSVPGQTFFYVSQAAGWGISVIFFAVTMTLTGVSFRFGDACHVNAYLSMGDFWGPLLAFASAAGLIQILTFLYCGKVYLREVLHDDRTDSGVSAGVPSFQGSTLRATSARAVWQRVKKVLWLQCRSITMIVFLLVDIIFLAIVWVQLDNAILAAKDGKLEHFLPFLTCLIAHAGVKDKCFHLGQEALVSEGIATASLMLLSLSGVQTGLMMSRTSMFVGWYELFMTKFGAKREFVSLDAKRYSQDARTFELMKAGESPRTQFTDTPDSPDLLKPGGGSIHSGAPTYEPPGSLQSERAYKQHNLSFSGRRSPSAQGGAATDWQTPEETFSRGGLHSHPPASPPPASPPPRGRSSFDPPSPPPPPSSLPRLPPFSTSPPQNR